MIEIFFAGSIIYKAFILTILAMIVCYPPFFPYTVNLPFPSIKVFSAVNCFFVISYDDMALSLFAIVALSLRDTNLLLFYVIVAGCLAFFCLIQVIIIGSFFLYYCIDLSFRFFVGVIYTEVAGLVYYIVITIILLVLKGLKYLLANLIIVRFSSYICLCRY